MKCECVWGSNWERTSVSSCPVHGQSFSFDDICSRIIGWKEVVDYRFIKNGMDEIISFDFCVVNGRNYIITAGIL